MMMLMCMFMCMLALRRTFDVGVGDEVDDGNEDNDNEEDDNESYADDNCYDDVSVLRMIDDDDGDVDDVRGLR